MLDLQELEQIESIVKRERIKAILQKEKLILQNEIQLIKKSQSQQENKASNDSKSRAPTVKITSYGLKLLFLLNYLHVIDQEWQTFVMEVNGS